jgi:Mrp family chromosome partitioning ATPase
MVGKYQNNSKELLKQIAMILPAVEYAPEENKELVKLLDYLEGLHEKLEAYVVKGTLPETTFDKTECFGEHRTMRTVSFINFKGGVGKTTVSTNFAYAIFCMLRDSGVRILFIDNDKQGNASDWFEADRQYGTIANVLMGDVPVRKVIQRTRYECIDLIAADTGLMEANAHLLEGVEPLARWMQPLAERRLMNGQTEDVAYYEPFYLKDFVAKQPRNLLNT